MRLWLWVLIEPAGVANELDEVFVGPKIGPVLRSTRPWVLLRNPRGMRTDLIAFQSGRALNVPLPPDVAHLYLGSDADGLLGS